MGVERAAGGEAGIERVALTAGTTRARAATKWYGPSRPHGEKAVAIILGQPRAICRDSRLVETGDHVRSGQSAGGYLGRLWPVAVARATIVQDAADELGEKGYLDRESVDREARGSAQAERLARSVHPSAMRCPGPSEFRPRSAT